MPSPTTLQIALALAVVKSKPSSISIEEHVKSLLRSLRRGGRKFPCDESLGHLDSTAYWRERYEKSRKANADLEAKNLDLQRIIDRLSAEAQETSTDLASTRSGRKRIAKEKSASQLPSKKRSKVDSLVEDVVVGDGPAGRMMSRVLLHLYDLLAQERTAVQAMASRVVQGCEALSDYIKEIFKPPRCPKVKRSPADQRQELGQVATAIARIVQTLLYCLERICSSSATPEPSGILVYHIVKAFSDVLSMLTEVDAAEDDGGQRQEALCQVLLAFMSVLKHSNSQDHDILEGIAFLIVREAAKLLHALTFHGVLGETANEEGILGPGGSSESDYRAAKVVLPYLCVLLQRVKELKLAFSATSGLSSVASDKLQRTLIRCAFGTTEAGKEVAMSCLRLPRQPNHTLPTIVEVGSEGETEQEVRKRLIAEMFAVVGLDILSSERDWIEEESN